MFTTPRGVSDGAPPTPRGRRDGAFAQSLRLAVQSLGDVWIDANFRETQPDELRIVQTFALAFFFVPIQSAAYLYLPKDQINFAAGMVSMVRNEGAGLGVAALNRLLARRAQFHQVRLGEHINCLSHATNELRAQAPHATEAAGATPGMAHQQAYAILYRLLEQQSMVLAYLDAFLVFSLMTLAIVPLVFLMRRSVTDGKTGHPGLVPPQPVTHVFRWRHAAEGRRSVDPTPC